MGTPRGRGVDTDSEVRVRFSSVVMEVVGLWGHSRAGDRPEWEARRDERRPMVRQRGLLASPVYFVALVFPHHGVGGALENLCYVLDRDHREGPDDRWRILLRRGPKAGLIVVLPYVEVGRETLNPKP